MLSSITCGVEGCEGGGVNCGSGGVLCSGCGVVGVPFGSAGSVLISVGGVGGGEMEARAAVELEASSSVTCTVTGGDFESLRAFEELQGMIYHHKRNGSFHLSMKALDMLYQ